MSLKAKIEAVIYASEEPVTLAQLMGLLGEEAQLELDAREAEQPSLALEELSTDAEESAEDEANDPDALNAETLEPEGSTETDAAQAETAEAGEAAETEGVPEAEGVADAETPVEPETGDDVRVEEPGTPVEATDENVEAAAEGVATTKEENAKAVAAEAKVRERKLRAYFREILDQLMAEYANGDRGLEVREVAGGFRLATKPEYHDAVRGFVKSLKPPLKLSLQALETLAVVAYKQPVTAPEVGEIRGVDSGGVLGSLLARKLIQTAGRKQVIGRPMLYKTSKEFLVRFGLKDINELPSIEEFERMASELNEAVQEEIPMPEHAPAEPGEEEAPAAEAADAPEETMSEEPKDPEAARRQPHEDVERGDDPDSEQAQRIREEEEDEPTGVEDVNPADNIIVDGRIVGGPHTDRYPEDEPTDSEELDAKVQGGAEE